MAGNVMAGKTLTIFLAADLKKFNSGINKAEGGLKGFGESISRNMGPILLAAGAAAGAFAVKVGIDAVKAASDLGETQNKVGVIFGNSSQSILDFAEDAVTGLGQTRIQALEASATFAQFGKAAGLSGGDLVNFSTELVTLSADLASFNNSSPDEAIDAIGSALRGEAEPLRRFGVLMDDAALKAAALSMGIGDGTTTLTTQQKVLAAHNVILSQTSDAQGDFARTSEGLANTQKILQAAVEDAKAEIGIGLVSALEAAGQAMGGSRGMAGVIQDTGQDLGDFASGIGVVITALAGLTGGIEDATEAAGKYETGIFGMRNAGNSLLDNILPLIPILGTWVSGILAVGENARISADKLIVFANAAKKTADGLPYFLGGLREVEKATNEQTAANVKATYGVLTLAERQAAYEKILEGTEDTIRNYGSSTGSATVEVEKLTKFQKFLEKSTEDVGKAIASTEALLSTQIQSFRDAKNAVADYVLTIQGNLLSGIDLGSAFTDQFDKEGNKTGVALVDAFNAQIAEAEWFGNVLEGLQNSQVDQRLIDYMAGLGPEVGGALGQEMLGDKGLMGTINEKFVNIQEKTKELALGLVPDFMNAGVQQAAAMVVGLANQLDYERDTLKKLGKNMAMPVGAAFKTQLASDVAAAVRNVEAAATAARAEKVADATAAQQLITDQQVARAIANVIRNSDARSGAVVTPVLS
jgi:hypothetical protein